MGSRDFLLNFQYNNFINNMFIVILKNYGYSLASKYFLSSSKSLNYLTK